MKRMLVFVLLIVIAGCSAPTEPAKPAVSKEADLAAIGKLRDSFMAAFNANDAAKIGEVYTEDAVTMAADQPTQKGRQAIVEANKATFEKMAAKIAITSEQTEVFGDNGFDRGTFSIAMTPKAGGKGMMSEGRYLVLLRRDPDGAWKVSTDIDNSSKPAPSPAEAKK